MKRLFAVIFVLPFAHSAFAQTGDAQAGKTLWESPMTQCRNCHGAKGQGAFGPDLAGRKLTVGQFIHAMRKPWGVMPAFVENQVSDAEAANLVAYFDSLPVNAEPGKWRFEVPADAVRGQMVALNAGCAQCHGPILSGPRAGMGSRGGSFDDFKRLVYNHTTEDPKHLAEIGERAPPRLRMGNFSPTRMWESQLKEIYDWAHDLGFRVNVRPRLGRGAPDAKGVTYKLDVENPALPDKGLAAEELTIRLLVPTGTEVVEASGAGYQGVSVDEKTKANVAVWKVQKLAPKDHQTYTITLSKAATAGSNLRGDIRWTKPAVKTGPFDEVAIAPAPL